MPNFVRWYEKGATYFFTVVTHGRRPILTTELARRCLREAWQDVTARFPFETDAVCLLPDHVHCLWSLPEEDEDFSTRWRAIAKKGDSPVSFNASQWGVFLFVGGVGAGGIGRIRWSRRIGPTDTDGHRQTRTNTDGPRNDSDEYRREGAVEARGRRRRSGGV